nr:hypothetical protein [Candidatus Neomarinimicrobiota bacterium]
MTPKRANVFLMIRTGIPIIIVSVAISFPVLAGDKTTVYDKNWNRTGYRITEGKTTTIYDKNWNRQGYEEK